MTNHNRGELKRLAREYLMGHYPTPILAMLAAAILPSIALAPFPLNPDNLLSLTTVIYGVASLIVSVLGQLLSINSSRIHLLLARRQQVNLADLLWSFRNRPDHFILGTLLITLIAAIPAVPLAAAAYLAVYQLGRTVTGYLAASAILLVLYAIELYISYTYGLTYLLYIDHPEYSVREGICQSKNLMYGHKWQLFVLQLSFLGMQLLGIGSLGIGLLWVSPYITQTMVNFYLDVTGQLNTPPEPENDTLVGQHINATITD